MSPVPVQRVVMVAHSHNLGGIERHVATLAHELADHGHALAYAGPAEGWMGEHMRAAGHTCLDLPMRGMFDPLSAWRLARFARRFGATVLHGHALRGGRYADWAGRWSGVPAVVTAHSTNAFRWFRPRMRLIAVSEAVRDALVAHGLPASRITVVYNGIPDPAVRHAPEVEPVTQQHPLRVGLVGRLDPVKGQDLALKALARLSLRLPVRLILAGAGQALWTLALQEQAQALGVSSLVEFLGPIDDIPGLLAGLDLIVAPSRREALSLALVETAAAGVASVGARIGGIPEVIQDGTSGVLVPPEDSDALAQAVESLALDPLRRRDFGLAARAHYEAHFTVTAMREGIEAVYSAAIEEGLAHRR